jgi:hypothetical protein
MRNKIPKTIGIFCVWGFFGDCFLSGALERKEIVQNFQGLYYGDLVKLIINDIDFEKLKEENLVFYFSCTCSLARDYGYGTILFSKSICETDSDNPAFNQIDFWTSKNIRRIQKKHHKNMIPYLQTIDNFVSVDESYKTFDEELQYYYYDESKKIIDIVRKKSKGNYIEKNTNYNGYKIEREKTFYYFPYKNKKNMVLTSIEGKKNFNTLFLSFTNIMDKKVVVKFEYDFPNNDERFYKVYQYQNKKWIEIPTK